MGLQESFLSTGDFIQTSPFCNCLYFDCVLFLIHKSFWCVSVDPKYAISIFNFNYNFNYILDNLMSILPLS